MFGLVQSIAYSVVQDHFKSQGAEKRGAKAKLVSIEVHDFAGQSLRDTHDLDRNVLIQEIAEALEKATSSSGEGQRDRTIFWLYYRQGLTTRAIASLPAIKLSAKGVESAIAKLTAEVRRRFVPEIAARAKGN